MTSACKRVITVATKAELKKPELYKHTWARARKVSLPRRKWLDAISHCFLRRDIRIVDEQGNPFDIPDIDDAFGDDPDMRWLSYYLKDNGNSGPLHRVRLFHRVKLIHLYLEIEHPETTLIFPGSSVVMLHGAVANERK